MDILKRCRWDSPVSEFNGFVGLNFSNFSVYCWVAHGSDISSRYIFMCLVSLLAFHAVAVQWNSHTCWEPFQYSSFYENGSVISTLYSLQNFQVTLTRLENPFVSSGQVWRLSNAIVPAHFTSLNKRWKIDWNLRKQLPRCWTDFFSNIFVLCCERANSSCRVQSIWTITIPVLSTRATNLELTIWMMHQFYNIGHVPIFYCPGCVQRCCIVSLPLDANHQSIFMQV